MTERGRRWADHANERLAARGHRAGGARAAVIEGLAEGGGCCTAAELAAALRAGGGRVATASVYRSLTTLQEAGLVRASDLGGGERRFELVHPDGLHHHHLVCRRCGRMVPFGDDALEQAIHAVEARLGAQVEAHEVTLHGLCADCR